MKKQSVRILWNSVKEIFQAWTTPGKQPEPDPSYFQLLRARATDRQRSFLPRSAWMLGYILLAIVVILVKILWTEVSDSGEKDPKPESGSDLVLDYLVHPLCSFWCGDD